MKYIELDNTLPNQKFNFKTDTATVEITLKTVDGIILMSVLSNGNNVISNIKVAPNVLILCYDYLQQQYGDFIFTTTNNEYPNYQNFNNSNKFYWLNYEEIKKYKASLNNND